MKNPFNVISNPHKSAFGSPVSDEAYAKGLEHASNIYGWFDVFCYYSLIFRWVLPRLERARAHSFARGWDDCLASLKKKFDELEQDDFMQWIEDRLFGEEKREV